MTTAAWVAFLYALFIGLVVGVWLERRRRLRALADRFVALTRERRATLSENSEESEPTGVVTPPGAKVALSLHRRNGRPAIEDGGGKG